MRAIALLLAAVVLIPAGMASASPASPPRAAARPANVDAHSPPNLMPPDPVSGRWPAAGMRATSTPTVPSATAVGEAPVLVLLVQFTNVTHEPGHEAATFDGFFNNATPTARSMRAYYREASYGSLTINAAIVPTWFTSSRPMEYYGRDGPSG